MPTFAHLHVEQLVYRLLPIVAPGRALADSEWRTLVKAAEILLEGSAADIEAEQVADNAETLFCVGRSRRMWRIRLLLTAVELLPLTTHGKRFSELGKAERRELAKEYLASDRFLWRTAGKVRFLVYLGAYGDEAGAKPTGFVPVRFRARFLDDSQSSVQNEPATRAAL